MQDDLPMLEDDFVFQCPHCWGDIHLRMHPSEGKKQNFSYDCEVCCQPVAIQAEFDNDGAICSFKADKES